MQAMFQGFGLPELGVILLVALILFGPSRLPEIGKSVGKALREFRQSSTEVTKALSEGLQASDEAEAPVKEQKPTDTERAEKESESSADEGAREKSISK